MAFESATAQTQSIERSDRSADVRANTAMTGFIDYHALGYFHFALWCVSVNLIALLVFHHDFISSRLCVWRNYEFSNRFCDSLTRDFHIHRLQRVDPKS